MTEEELDCRQCDSSFSSWDELVDHLDDSHDFDRDRLLLVPEDDLPKQPQVVEGQQTRGQQNLLAPLVERPTETEQLVRAIGDELSTSKKLTIIRQMGLSLLVTVVVLLVLGAVTFLTLRGIISGSVFAFSLGTLIGYLLSFLEDLRVA